jgi:hypothetical protein
MVPFPLLMDARTAVLVMDNAKVESEVLNLILSLFSGDEDKYRVDLLKEDWTTMFEIATKCLLRASETSDSRPIYGRPRTLSPAANIVASLVFGKVFIIFRPANRLLGHAWSSVVYSASWPFVPR